MPTCFFCLPHLSLNLIPLQTQLHISPIVEETKLYSWQELPMKIRGGGIGVLWRNSTAPPLYYIQSLGSPLPASCILLGHLNWVSRAKSDFFSTYFDVWVGHWSPSLHRDSFLENTTANRKWSHCSATAKWLWDPCSPAAPLGISVLRSGLATRSVSFAWIFSVYLGKKWIHVQKSCGLILQAPSGKGGAVSRRWHGGGRVSQERGCALLRGPRERSSSPILRAYFEGNFCVVVLTAGPAGTLWKRWSIKYPLVPLRSGIQWLTACKTSALCKP